MSKEFTTFVALQANAPTLRNPESYSASSDLEEMVRTNTFPVGFDDPFAIMPNSNFQS